MTDPSRPTGGAAGIEAVPREECLHLLATHALGRLAVVSDGHPLVFPVNYALDGESIVFRTDVGTKLFATVSEHDVAFEIDGADTLYHTGWSVLVVGTGTEVTDPGEQARLTHLRRGPWCPGPKSHWIRIRPREVTGRRIPVHHEPHSS